MTRKHDRAPEILLQAKDGWDAVIKAIIGRQVQPNLTNGRLRLGFHRRVAMLKSRCPKPKRGETAIYAHPGILKRRLAV